MRYISSLLAVAVFAATASCGGSGTEPGGYGNTTGGSNSPPPGGGSTTGPTTNSLVVNNNYYDPPSTTVSKGTQVTWTWNACTGDGYGGSVCTDHSVTFDDGPTSGLQTTGSYQRAFSTPGEYAYHCSLHGSAMSGKIIVK
jgi:plastocyanin